MEKLGTLFKGSMTLLVIIFYGCFLAGNLHARHSVEPLAFF